MKLCARCVAALVREPLFVRVGDMDRGAASVEKIIDVIEAHADGHPDALPLYFDGPSVQRQVRLRAVTEVQGVPLCTWCIATEPIR